MTVTLSVDLDSELLKLAESEAQARHTTVAEVVSQQVQVMAQNWRDSRAGRTPITDALRGSVKLPADFSARAALADELQKKHGG